MSDQEFYHRILKTFGTLAIDYALLEEVRKRMEK